MRYALNQNFNRQITMFMEKWENLFSSSRCNETFASVQFNVEKMDIMEMQKFSYWSVCKERERAREQKMYATMTPTSTPMRPQVAQKLMHKKSHCSK